MSRHFDFFPARLLERIVNEDEITWPRPRLDPSREPSHFWARVEDRKADRERAREWEREHRKP